MARLLGVSHVSIINWVKKYGSQLISINNPRSCRIMKLDKLYSYIGTKKTIDGFGLSLIEMPDNTLIWPWRTEVSKTGSKLWNK